MHVYCFQHVPFEGLGSIEFWLKSNNFDMTYTYRSILSVSIIYIWYFTSTVKLF